MVSKEEETFTEEEELTENGPIRMEPTEEESKEEVIKEKTTQMAEEEAAEGGGKGGGDGSLDAHLHTLCCGTSRAHTQPAPPVNVAHV